jgi:hypothetical protein
MDGGTSENHEQPQFAKQVPYLRYELSTSHRKVYHVAVWDNLLGYNELEHLMLLKLKSMVLI